MIASVDELVAYMSGIELDVEQRAACVDILEGVQAELEVWLGRPVEPGVCTEKVLPDTAGRVFPTYTPVTRLLQVDGVDWDGDVTDLWRGGFWGSQTISYEYGFTPQDQKALKLAVLRVAAREAEQLHDDTRSAKDLSTRNEGEMQLRQKIGFQPDELSPRFDRLRRKVAV